MAKTGGQTNFLPCQLMILSKKSLELRSYFMIGSFTRQETLVLIYWLSCNSQDLVFSLETVLNEFKVCGRSQMLIII